MIKKEWAYALGILSLTTSMVVADQGSTQSDRDKKMPPKPMGVTSQPTGVITPPVGPRVEDGANVIITADFIYWKARQDGLQFAQSGFQAPEAVVPVGNTVAQGHVAQAGGRFEPGFKVGLGIEFEHDGWDLYAQYTWLAPRTSTTTVTAGVPSTLENTWSNRFLAAGSVIQGASGSWRLNYDVVDLELGRNFFLSRFLTMRPHFGLKGTWLKQRNNVYYQLGTFTPASFTDMAISATQKAWGIGVRGGFDTVWHFCREFGMYGDFALSALWSNYKNRRTDTLQNPTATLTAQVANLRSGIHEVTPVLELGLGLVYMTWFHNDDYMFDFRAGWEEQVWFDTNHFFRTTGGNSGNFSTQGLTVKVGFAF